MGLLERPELGRVGSDWNKIARLEERRCDGKDKAQTRQIYTRVVMGAWCDLTCETLMLFAGLTALYEAVENRLDYSGACLLVGGVLMVADNYFERTRRNYLRRLEAEERKRI